MLISLVFRADSKINHVTIFYNLKNKFKGKQGAIKCGKINKDNNFWHIENSRCILGVHNTIS